MHLTIHEENETLGIAVSTHNVRDAGANVSEKCGEESSTYPSSWNLCYTVVCHTPLMPATSVSRTAFKGPSYDAFEDGVHSTQPSLAWQFGLPSDALYKGSCTELEPSKGVYDAVSSAAKALRLRCLLGDLL